ncbi:MAG: ribosomal RNA small subunit methyltransferase A [Lentisphaeria bacterium]|nr:ribosomal RNA small subunit methyltransferase A [Lentisphaeria bacterium]
MTKTELLVILDEIGVRPSRRMGQNFLVDTNMLDALVRAAAPAAGEHVLEVGPGTGVLTRRLLEAGCRVTAVELDHRLASYLRRDLEGAPGFRLIEEDACKVDYETLMGDAPYRCIANLPYACGTVFLAGMLTLANSPLDFHVLLQKEMAERIVAPSGTKTYGVFTVRVGLRYRAEIVRVVPAGVFYPPPDVASAFVRMVRHGRIDEGVCATAAELATLAFGQRRKKALPLMARRFEATRLQAAFDELGILPGARAETIAVSQYTALAERVG